MVTDAFVTVMDLVAPLAEAQTQVNVFEAVEEGGVEAPGLLERLPSEENRGRGHDLEAAGFVYGGMISGEAGVEMPGVEVLANHHAGVLDRAVGVEQLAADGGRAGVAFGVAYKD